MLTVGAEQDTPLRFFVQTRIDPGARATVVEQLERVDHPSATDLWALVPGVGRSLAFVVRQLDLAGSPALAVCFDEAFQPLRRLLYGPADQRHRDHIWQQVAVHRPLFMAVNLNGLHLKSGDVALLQCTDAADGVDKNLVVFAPKDLPADWAGALSDTHFGILAGLLDVCIRLLLETMSPLDPRLFQRRGEYADLGASAKSAVEWFLDHAGEIKDAIELVRLFTG